MSVAFIFGPNSPMIDLGDTISFYEESAAMRRSFDRTSQWTGLSTDLLLGLSAVDDPRATMRISSMTLAATSFGIQDALEECGLRPAIVGGLSLGDVLATAAAGALTRRQVIDMMWNADDGPASPAPGHEEGVAFAFAPADQDPGPYYRPQHEGVYSCVQFGTVASGEGEAFLLAGYRAALEALAADDQNVWVRDQGLCCAAYHTPLRGNDRASLEQLLADMPPSDPVVPMATSILGQPVTTAAGVRELLLRNAVEPVRVRRMVEQIAAQEPRLTVTIGPVMAKGLISFPFPVTHVDSLPTLAAALEASAELGLTASATR
jgi:[acyl-carrier-protein] S-malonyltransferase